MCQRSYGFMLRKNAALVKAHVSLTSHVSWRPRKYDRPRSRVERTTDEAVAYRDVKDVWRYAHERGAVAHDSPASVVDGQPILFDAKRPDHHLWGAWWLPRPLRESTSILRYIALGLPTRHGTHDSVDVSLYHLIFTLSQASIDRGGRQGLPVALRDRPGGPCNDRKAEVVDLRHAKGCRRVL